jgi:hypothetical protein
MTASNRLASNFSFARSFHMPGFDQASLDNTVENRRLGSILLTAGWILLWVAIIFGMIFFFNSLRDGSWFWPIGLGIVGLVGFVLVVMGTRYRRTVGATRLGQRDLARTLRQQKQDDDEEQTVA